MSRKPTSLSNKAIDKFLAKEREETPITLTRGEIKDYILYKLRQYFQKNAKNL